MPHIVSKLSGDVWLLKRKHVLIAVLRWISHIIARRPLSGRLHPHLEVGLIHRSDSSGLPTRLHRKAASLRSSLPSFYLVSACKKSLGLAPEAI